MHIHQPYVAEVVSVSANGRTATSHVHAVDIQPSLPGYSQEDIVTNGAVESWEFSYDLGDTSLLAEVQAPNTDGIVLTAKRKVYKNSDYPMLTWANHQDEYLEEMLRLEGRGYQAIYSRCGGCEEAAPTFRCEHQTCHGPSLFCKTCIMERHAVLPTHWIQEWNGGFFKRRALIDLGLSIQLGHPLGYSCPSPLKAPKDFVVIDVTGVHHVAVNFCQCDSRVEKRQQLMRVCWWPATARNQPADMRNFRSVSAHDFLRSLEFLTNNNGLNPPPDRRRAFRHIVRQYRMTLMMKHAGRGHDPSGVKGTAQGELALQCRSCPQPGKNLPEGWDRINWDEMPEDLRYKYFLFLAQDCNFRLINRNIGSTAKDPILGDGYGYFVNNEKYAEYLRGHVSDEEISSCSGFQAMFLANRKHVKGLRTTSVGGVTCARHNMWRANGIGDLQLGERQCNMDFILLSSLLNIILFYLILSYDIACQYGKNFWSRMESLPEVMCLVIERSRVWFKVPNFHLPPHKPPYFPKRMAENVKEGQVHRDAFEAFDKALRDNAPDMVAGWKAWVDDWESRQHTDNTESPFEVKENVMSMRDIRLKLAKEELLRSGEGEEVEREDTPSTFVIMGLKIEEAQRHLAIDVKAVANLTDAQTVDILKRRVALVKRIRAFRNLQRTYMPKLRRFPTATQHELWDSEAERNTEAMQLFMPSDILDRQTRERACAVGLPEVETDLRTGFAHPYNDESVLPSSMYGPAYAHEGPRGASASQFEDSQSKTALQGHGPWERELRVLEDSDMRALNERALTEEEAEQRKAVHDYEDVAEEGGIASEDPSEEELVEALRVEWCKAYARMRRWHEDVILVEKEMRRTIEYGYWSAREWAKRGGARASGVDEELLEGLTVYAREQEDREITMSVQLAAKWARIREKGRAFLARESAPGEEIVVLLDSDDEGAGDEEEGQPDYEDEGDDKILE
ncbi:hypothetical protein K438DRAFT_2004166 [Mycena galopus ATCC 62051]|nr:hypothetical protein K438DRAFT_2004166 [Mycena galopus ATCC 62051]